MHDCILYGCVYYRHTHLFSFCLQGQTALALVEHSLTSHKSNTRSKHNYELEEEHISIRNILRKVRSAVFTVNNVH